VPWTVATNPCAEASSYDSEGIIEDVGMACGSVVPGVMDGVTISAETCQEVIDPFGMGDFTRSTYLSYAAASCCSDAGSVCSASAAQLCDDPSYFDQTNAECLNWQALLGAPTEGDAATWCAEEVLGPSVSCVEADDNCLWMTRATVTAFSHSGCCNGGSDVCGNALPISTCAGAQSRWYGLHGICPEECHGDGDDEVCTRSPNTCGTASCETYLSRFTMEYTEELTAGLLECDPQTDVHSLASMGAEHVHAVGPVDIRDLCGLTDAVTGNADNDSSTDMSSYSDSATDVLLMQFLIPSALFLACF